MLEQSLKEQAWYGFISLGLVIGFAIGFFAGILASIVRPAEPVYIALTGTAMLFCFLFSLTHYLLISIGLAIGLGAGFLIERFIFNPFAFSPDIGVSIIAIGLFLAMVGWGLGSLLVQKNESA